MPHSPLAQLARACDRDRFLAALFAPEGRREALFALIAFNGEIARVRETVKEPMLGLVRLQWWRDALAAARAGTPPRHPVVEALAEVFAAHDVPDAPFHRLLDARAFDLESEPPEDMSALAAYAEATSSALVELMLHVLGTPEAMAAGRPLGIAYALSGLMRAVPHDANLGKIFLPRAALRAAGISGDPFAMRNRAALANIIGGVCAEARTYLDEARRIGAPRAALPALLHGRLAAADMKRLARGGFDPTTRRAQGGHALRPLLVAWGHWRGRV